VLAVWSWLLEMVELDREVDPEEGAKALTDAGLEVESIERVGSDFDGVVIAEVVGQRRHPDADKLTLVSVIEAEGGAATELVCGAPNVPAAGGRVLWAKPGSTLAGGYRIDARKVRGVMSAGMLCSERELGLSDDHQGIIVLGEHDRRADLGELAHSALGLRDVVFEIGAPANRPDAQGHAGLARELAAHLGCAFKPMTVDLGDLETDELVADELIRVSIDDPEGCPRYVARLIDGLTLGPSPQWVQQRLRAVGVRPISNLVDITNYVMFELGQPLHAFDYRRVAGAHVHVRRAHAGERMTTLDDIERTLEPTDLLICDDNGPVALAGVMGGAESEVSDATSRVLLESAHFHPASIRRTAKRLGLHSESSYRFERHVDPNTSDLAAARAAQLMALLGSGRVAKGMVDAYPVRREPWKVSIRASRTSLLTGVEFSRPKIAELLGRLGLETEQDAEDDVLQVTCPTSRPDLTREVDLIEEVLRVHGFDKVPVTMPHTEVPPSGAGDPRPAAVRSALAAIGMSEAITFGFTSPERIAALQLAADDPRSRPIEIRNPMSVEQSVMRTSLLPNLLASVSRNISFDVRQVRLFEVGSVFLPAKPGAADAGLPDEPVHLAGVMTGQRDGWLRPGEALDFFDAKGVVERSLVALLGSEEAACQVSFVATSAVPYMHPGACAAVTLPDGSVVGEVGEIHPTTRRALGVEQACFGFELDLTVLPLPEPAQMRAISRHPAITRDVSFFLDEDVPAARVSALIEESGESLLERISLLEDYRDPDKVPPGKKGMLWSITYRSPERTLTDEEADAAHEAIVTRLLSSLSAQRR